MTRTSNIQLPASVHDLAVRAGALALVAVLMGSSGEIPVVLGAVERWRLAIPRADWIAVSLSSAVLRPHRPWLGRILSNELARRRMDPSQLILVGRGRPGRLALDRVLDGTLACAGFVALEIPLTSPGGEIGSARAGIRFVLRESDAGPRTGATLIETMRSADLDLRSLTLPAPGHDDEETLTRAAGTFLVELAAKASGHQRRL